MNGGRPHFVQQSTDRLRRVSATTPAITLLGCQKRAYEFSGTSERILKRCAACTGLGLGFSRFILSPGLVQFMQDNSGFGCFPYLTMSHLRRGWSFVV